ncbi:MULTISPECIES: hypothetical protein [Pseudomonas]|uniref:Uncharacterized protein n=4 Tax=Pseudomonas syringae group TaxID=136849 RepID=A0A3M4JCZ9_PSEVI|nr:MULTISPECIES: hypothetical protein [Pseudomonas]KPW31501.1 Uncharacterized protein ALO51_00649 [Pseudomonas amygdali]KPX77936.1 Uncharacterized protein ALO59_02496 [Pseudomonas amygdali pv. mellea]KTB74369.1 hypothetical protein AO068_17410 [Pseudomonas sp. ICMP 3272]KTC55466.1 hypothetical protein AO258_25260 [Pseudomonas syringae ICMP 19498]KTC59908.1 hypothetical protein AO287_07865 [Pseudomonas savastanoi]
MKTTHLQHHPSLGYLAAGSLRNLPVGLLLPHECSGFVSFRAHPFRKPERVIKNLHAAQRPLSMYGAGSYCFYGVQSDSPLAPLLLWDGAHFLNVGEKITVIEDTEFECYLDREYFAGSLKVIERSATSVTYKKVARLAAESDDDLDGWSFCLPVGPGDATVLNAVVKRILEIDVPRKEILLCGTPGSNFAYFDKVRLVGQDITAPPVQICKKKNRLALEAGFSNLVILHDRVFLPRNFGEIVRRFGPRYPLMTLQSMFFDNRLSMHPRRYSDYGMAMEQVAQGLLGLHRTSGNAQAIAPSVFSEVDRTGFCFASPMRHNSDASYPTGSLYICRKDVWNACPLDESLHWVEYEDIEHALRASRAGIPNRINPFGITQSVTSRALLGGKASVESVDGCLGISGPCYVSLLKKKPLLNLSAETALVRLRQFADKYLANPSAVIIPTGLDCISVRAWIELIDHIAQQSSFRNDIDAVKEFLADFERLMLFDQLTQTRQAFLVNRFLADPVLAKQTLITQSCEVRNMLRQRSTQAWFVRQQDDYFHHHLLSLPGILISAVRTYRNNGKIFYFESVWAAVKAIYNSTPFKSYARGSK